MCVDKTALLDHLVGEREQIRWYLQTEYLCCFEIDSQLDFCSLHDRQVGRRLAGDRLGISLAARLSPLHKGAAIEKIRPQGSENPGPRW
jgi:hypothetical protein